MSARQIDFPVENIVSRLKNCVVTVLVLLFLLSCSRGAEIWKEEVRLQNGDLLIVDREFRYGSSGEASLSHGPLAWAGMDFDYKGRTYHWEAEGLWPMALQLDKAGRFYVVTTIPYCTVWRARGKPDSYYVIFIFDSGSWREARLEDIDVSTPFNLAGSSKGLHSNERKSYVKESDTKFNGNGLTQEANRRIVTEKRPRC